MRHLKTDRNQIILICAVVINLQLGMSYAWSVFSNTLIETWGWTYADAVLPGTASSVAYGVSMLVFGLFQEKYGTRMTVRTGSLLMGFGLLLAGRFVTLPGIVLGYGILHGLGVGACFSATQATVLKKTSTSRQGLVSGIISSAYGLSSVLISVLANAVITEWGISAAFYTIAVILMVMTFTAGSFFDPSEKKTDTLLPEETGKEAYTDKNCLAMIKTREFYYLLGIYIFGAAATMVPISHISMIISMQGDVADGYIFVSIISVFNCIGRLAGGYLGDRLSERTALLFTGILSLCNLLLFGSYTSALPFAIGSAIDGWHYGMLMALTPVLVSKLFGRKYCAQNYGLIAFLGLASGFMGSQAAGYMVDQYGSYQRVYMLCAIYLALNVLLVLRLPGRDRNR